MVAKEAQVSGQLSEHRWRQPAGGNPVASRPRLNGALVDLFGICQRERSHFQ